jgi:general L-amino acid transport system substrate-binding protein|tara:strand:- start:384 stop:1706 length:1323 start_codon:yes stop_codon:yes gene_type:complete
MTRTVALFLALLLIALPLVGCIGEDTELNAANERIADLETQAEDDQERIAELESEAEADEATYQKLMDDFSEQSILINQLMENCCTWEDMDQAWDDGYASGMADSSQGSTLDVIMDRGYMNCGVKNSQYGMGYLDENGVRSGLDIEYCRAIAAAIGLVPDTDINYVLASGSNRFELLANGDIDVLIRTTTWTTSRDAGLNAEFGGINFYDGQGIIVNTDNFPNAETALDLEGASICVAVGSTSAGNIADFFNENGMNYTAVNSWNDGPDFADELCDAVTGDMSSLVSMKWEMEVNGYADFGMTIMPELISKEPLASVTRDYDSEWNEIVSWVWYGMITAEEMGISSQNYQSADTSVPSIDRLLNQNLGLGTNANPLPNDWMQLVLNAVGNYGETYDRAFCDGTYDGVSGSDAMTGCLISRSGTYNALVSEGGLQYAPSMR